jgi:alpha-amylase/alpha-mannosidase (GH57 family)
MPTKSFCAHGHFYQPPRIDPFTNQIPQEFGAAPHGNWTEKIFYQCYEPNASLGNFRKISFNIGPTLFSWLDENHPETVRRIVEQENHTYKHTGVSNAMAHPYFHLIFPLASRRDGISITRPPDVGYQKQQWTCLRSKRLPIMA